MCNPPPAPPLWQIISGRVYPLSLPVRHQAPQDPPAAVHSTVLIVLASVNYHASNVAECEQHHGWEPVAQNATRVSESALPGLFITRTLLTPNFTKGPSFHPPHPPTEPQHRFRSLRGSLCATLPQSPSLPLTWFNTPPRQCCRQPTVATDRMKLLLLASLSLLASLGAGLPAPTRSALQLPKELRGVDPNALASCGGGTGFCSRGRCLCSGICEGICDWYECGGC